MSAASRRRIILSVSLASLLLGGCGLAGFLAIRQWQSESTAKSAELSEDLDQGFAEEGGAPLSDVADRWVDGPREAPIKVASHEEPVEATGPVEGGPESSRVAQDPIDAEPVEPFAGAALPPLQDAPADRYAAVPEPAATNLPAPQTPGPENTDRYAQDVLPPLEAMPASQGGTAPPVARGQTPLDDGDLPPLEAEEANPLRGADKTPSPGSARKAFEAPQSGDDANLGPLGPPPGEALDANPLRAQQAPVDSDGRYGEMEQAAAPADRFANARPLEAVPQGGPPREELAPLDASGLQDGPDPLPRGGMAPTLPMNDEELRRAAPTPRSESPYDRQAVPALAPQGESYLPATEDTMPEGQSGNGRPGESALEGPQRPALVMQKFAPAEIQVGKVAKFVIKLRNVGQRPADAVRVVDEIPQGTELVGTSPQASASGGLIEWELGSLSPGEERLLEIELMPTEEGEIGSVARVSFASQASVKTRCTRPQLAVRMSCPPEVLVGRQQPVTIELHNPGTGDATGVMLLENVPDNVSHQAGPALEFEVGTLRAGETRRMELLLTAEKPGHVVNVLTAQAEGNLRVQQQVEFEVVAPSLAVGIEGPSKRYLERQATYTVSIDNPGTATARDVQLVTKLPKGMQFVRTNNHGQYDAASHSVYWSLAELPEGEQGTVELVTLPIQPGDHILEVEGRAREGLQDRTTQQVSIEGLAAIMFEVADTADPIEVGGSTSYDIRVVNQGSKAASNVQVKVRVPQGMKVSGATGETRHVTEAEGVVFAPLAKLAPKTDSVFRVQLQGVTPGDQRIAVEVTTDEIADPIRKEESTRVFGDE